MKSFKTTLAGIISGLAVGGHAVLSGVEQGVFTGKHGLELVLALGLTLLGATEKDNNVTGGTIQQ